MIKCIHTQTACPSSKVIKLKSAALHRLKLPYSRDVMVFSLNHFLDCMQLRKPLDANAETQAACKLKQNWHKKIHSLERANSQAMFGDATKSITFACVHFDREAYKLLKLKSFAHPIVMWHDGLLNAGVFLLQVDANGCLSACDF